MRTLAVARTFRVPAPAALALAIVRDLQSLERFEPKIDALELYPRGPEHGVFRARGRALGKRWSGEFRYQLHADGFESAEIAPNRSGLSACGGFRIQPDGAWQCLITHYERYTLPLWAVPMKRALAWYVGRSIDAELRNLARLVLEHGEAVAA